MGTLLQAHNEQTVHANSVIIMLAWEYTIAGLDWWTGLVDWTGGLDWWTDL